MFLRIYLAGRFSNDSVVGERLLRKIGRLCGADDFAELEMQKVISTYS